MSKLTSGIPREEPAPWMVTIPSASYLFGGNIKMIQRLLHATKHDIPRADGTPWLDVRWGGRGRETRILTSSLREAFFRIWLGEEPPLLPSEKRRGEESESKE